MDDDESSFKMDMDDDERKEISGIFLGQDISALSIDELNKRIGHLRAEISRVEAEIVTKKSTMSGAEAVFKF